MYNSFSTGTSLASGSVGIGQRAAARDLVPSTGASSKTLTPLGKEISEKAATAVTPAKSSHLSTVAVSRPHVASDSEPSSRVATAGRRSPSDLEDLVAALDPETLLRQAAVNVEAQHADKSRDAAALDSKKMEADNRQSSSQLPPVTSPPVSEDVAAPTSTSFTLHSNGALGGAGGRDETASERTSGDAQQPTPTKSGVNLPRPAALKTFSTDGGKLFEEELESPEIKVSRSRRGSITSKHKASTSMFNLLHGAKTSRHKVKQSRRRSFTGAATATKLLSGSKKRPRSSTEKKRTEHKRLDVEYDIKTMHKLDKTMDGANIRFAVVVNEKVWAASRAGHISIRDPFTGDEITTLQHEDEKDFVTCILGVGHEDVWAGTSDGAIRVYDCESHELRKTLRNHLGYVYDMQRDRLVRAEVDQSYVWSCSNDFTCIQWTEDGDLLRQYTGHTNSMRCLLVLGPYLWTGSDDHTIRVYSTKDASCVKLLDKHSDTVLALCLTVTNTYSLTTGQDQSSSESDIACVLSSSNDGTVRMWSVRSPYTCLNTLELGARVEAMIPLGPEVWSCGEKGDLAVWRSSNMSVEEHLTKHAGTVSGLLHVRTEEARYCWSFSTSDKQLNVWKQSSSMLGSGVRHKDPVEGALKAFADESEERHKVALEESNAAKAELERQLAELQELYDQDKLKWADSAELDAERARRVAAEERVEILEEEAARRAKDISDWEKKYKVSEDQNAALQHKIDEQNAEITELRRSEEERMRSLREKLAALQEQYDRDIGERDSRNADLQAKLDSAIDRMKNMKETLERLRAENVELRKAAEELHALRSRIAELEAELSRECDRALELETQLNALLKERSEDEELRRLRDALSKQTAETERLQKALLSKEHALAKLQTRFDQLDAFKLDFVGREMKVLQKTMGRVKFELDKFDTRSLETKKDQDATKSLATVMDEILRGGMRHVEEVIADCFTEAQRLHLGSNMT